MNNPPDISPTEHETEHYAHEVSKHVRGYLLVGATLLAFTALTVALSYVHLRLAKGERGGGAILSRLSRPDSSAYIFMHLSAEKKLIYRILIFTAIFVLGLFWLTFLAWYDPVVH